MSVHLLTLVFSMRGTPRPNKNVTYDLSSSVMNISAPPLRPARAVRPTRCTKKDGSTKEEEGCVEMKRLE